MPDPHSTNGDCPLRRINTPVTWPISSISPEKKTRIKSSAAENFLASSSWIRGWQLRLKKTFNNRSFRLKDQNYTYE